MTQFDRFERELPLALRDVAGPHSPDYLTDILGRTAHTRQRPAWASLERWLPMDLATARVPVTRVPWRPLAAVTLLGLLLAALLAVYAGSQRHVPPPFGPALNGLVPYETGEDIYVADPATGESRMLVGGPDDDHDPTFTPDGTLIGFIRSVPQGDDVYVVRPDGGDLRRITLQPLENIMATTWAPTSDGLVVAHDVDGTQHLDVLDLRGAAPPRTISMGHDIDQVVFRPPSGKEVLVRGTFDGQGGLYALSPDGTSHRLLVKASLPLLRNVDVQDLNGPTYSPDGTRIYYNRYMSDAGGIQAWVMNADGSDQRRFNASGPPCCWWEGEMAPSPDGKSLIMWRVAPNDGGSAITIFPADGSGDGRAIGPTLAGTGDWHWAPDSSALLLKPNDPSDGGQKLVNPSDGTWAAPPWSASSEPDWQRLAP